MAVKRYYCPICKQVTGAEDEKTGEHEYINAARWWEGSLYCKNCYNEYVLDKVAFMGGIDGLEFE